MRTQLILLTSVAALVVACSDRQQPTSPAGIERDAGPRPAASSAVAPVTPAAKPADQVGFTKVVRVESSLAPIAANGDGSAIAYCPTGSTVVGGGHYLTGAALVFSPPLVSVSEPIPGTQPGWGVMVLNHAAGAALVNLHAYALCVS